MKVEKVVGAASLNNKDINNAEDEEERRRSAAAEVGEKSLASYEFRKSYGLTPEKLEQIRKDKKDFDTVFEEELRKP